MSAPPHLNLETEVHELFEAKLREFAAFLAEHWLMAEGEAMNLTNPSICPIEYERGYNDAMTTGIEGALDHWLDEMGYAR